MRRTIALLTLACSTACVEHVDVAKLSYVPRPPPPADVARDASPPRAAVHELADTWQQTVLPNGLTVVFIERPELPDVALRLVVERGAVDTADAGATAVAQAQFFFRRGGDAETIRTTARRTSELETTVVRRSFQAGEDLSLQVISANLEAGLSLLADLARATTLSASEYRSLSSRWGEPAQLLRSPVEAFERETLFGTTSPLGHAGWGKDVLPRETLARLRASLYQPGQCTLFVVGDTSASAAFAAATQSFGSWKPGPVLPKVLAAPPAVEGERLAWIESWAMTQTHASLFARGPVPGSPELDAFRLLVTLLGSPSSRIIGELREGLGASYAPGATLHEERVASWISVESLYAPTRTVVGMKAIVDLIHVLRAGKLPQADLEDAREALLGQWRGQLATPYEASAAYAGALLAGESLDAVRTLPDRLRRVTVEDLARVAERYLRDEQLHIVFQGAQVRDVGDIGLGRVHTVELAVPRTP